MKFPKLRWLPRISVLFLSGFHFLFSQVLSPPTLSSTHGNGPVISVCDSETVTFTATGDLGPTANDAEFRIIRAGVILYPLGAPGPQSILSFSSSSLQNGDQVVATVWTYDYGPAGGASSTTNTITISFDKESSQKLPIALAVQGGVELDINPYQYGFLPENSFLFLYNSVRFIQKSTLINLSQDLQLSNFSMGLNQRASIVDGFNLNR